MIAIFNTIIKRCKIYTLRVILAEFYVKGVQEHMHRERDIYRKGQGEKGHEKNVGPKGNRKRTRTNLKGAGTEALNSPFELF